MSYIMRLFVIVLLLIVFARTSGHGEPSAGKSANDDSNTIPVPMQNAQHEARELVQEVYGENIRKANSTEQTKSLVLKLLKQADASKNDKTAYFVLLDVAKNVSVEAGDVETALNIVTTISETYQIDILQAKVKAFELAAQSAPTSEQHRVNANIATELIDAVVARDDYEAATRLNKLASLAARKSNDDKTKTRIRSLQRHVETVGRKYQELTTARQSIESQPTDSEANLAIGRFLCLYKRNWDQGISMLALGNDPVLSSLARQELERPPLNAEDQVKLGDGWWDFAQTTKGFENESALLRAGYWYKKSQPHVSSGLLRAKISKRLTHINPREGTQPRAQTAPNQTVDRESKKQQPAPQPNRKQVVVEGVGWGPFCVGATRADLTKALGNPDAGSTDQWLQWKQKFHVHCLVDDQRGAFELRFDRGFPLHLSSGVAIDSPEQAVQTAYGQPDHITNNGTAKKLEYSGHGILFWISGGRVNQFVVFKARKNAD